MFTVSGDHWLVGAERLPSPNANDRPDADDVSLVVIHGISLPPGEFGTGCVEALFLNRLDTTAHPVLADLKDLRVSCHLFLDRQGRAVQFVPFHRRAWHAGASSHGGRRGCNDFAIGIELEGTDNVPYEDAQYRTLAAVLGALLRRYPRLSLAGVVGHAEIAPGRKTDPGPAFDWPRLYALLRARRGPTPPAAGDPAALRIGIDLGGTKIEAVLLDADGSVLHRRREPTPGGYAACLTALRAVVADMDEASGGARAPVGIGTPGAWVDGAIKNCNATWMNGRPLLDDLNHALAGRVRIANDADCFALAEALDGAGRGARTVFGVILGTGVGGGIVVDGRLLAGPNAIAGEWGHTPMPYLRADAATVDLERKLADRTCYCGRVNCVETFLSGPGLAATHHALTGQALPAEGIARDAPSVELYVAMLARALAQIANILDPDVMVLGGGVSRLPALAPRVQRLLPRYGFSHEAATRVVTAAQGDASGVLGAARLWPLEGGDGNL